MNFPSFSDPQPSSRLRLTMLILFICSGAILLLGILYILVPFGSLVRTQVAGNGGERIVTGGISTTNLTSGGHQLEIIAQTVRGDDIDQILAFTAQRPAPAPTPPPSSGGGGGGGGGSGGNASQPESAKPKFIFTFQPEKGHVISGSYSGVFTDGKRKIVRLAHGAAVLEKAIKVPSANYWLEMTVKDDRPGPVKVGIYINGRRWKTVTLANNDDKYRTVRIGMLRKFQSGTIRFQLLNDIYDKKNPGYPPTDRNFEIDSWRLVSEK